MKIQDVEDQPPEFVVVSPVTRISEDAPVGTSVLQGKVALLKLIMEHTVKCKFKHALRLTTCCLRHGVTIIVTRNVLLVRFTQNGSYILVRAIDGDRGVNNKISYSIVSGAQAVFGIDAETGVVHTLKPIDREAIINNNNGAYILEIQVLLSLHIVV